jgi:nitroreductase
MREMHAESSLTSPKEVAAWRDERHSGGTDLGSSRQHPVNDSVVVPLQPLSDAEIPRDPIEQVILRRGSSRQFARSPISFAQLSTMLQRATRGVPADFLISDKEVVALIGSLEDEVNNGGFDQFFYNNAGDNTAEIIKALETIGAAKMADIVKRAASMFPGGMPPKDRFRRQDVLLENFPHAVAFRSLDEEFYRYPDDLRVLLAKYTDAIPPQLNDLYLIVHAVEGLEPGAYFCRRDAQVLECLKRGDFRNEAGYLGLEQQLPADAAVDIFFLADLRPIFSRLGNRGYRAVQLEAGIVGGRIYLAAYAQRLGATGLTFYDDDVTRFFSPHAEGKSAIFLVAVGHSLKRHPQRNPD